MNKKSGLIIAIIGFFGGAAIIRSLMRPEVNTTYLIFGVMLLAIAIFLFINKIRKI
jgi:LPXTG-motif cell wall-anchored protein